MWKDSRNNLKLFQHKKFEKKEAFGKVVLASVVRERSKDNKEELEDYFKIENEYGDEILLDLSIMNPALVGSNSFSKKVVAYRCSEGGNVKIASFFSRLSHSKDFSNHDPNMFSPIGLKLDASDCESVEFTEFLAAAKEHATAVTAGREEAVQSIAVKTNRKRKVNKENTKPLTKQERMEKFFQKELKDLKGAEKVHVEYLQGRADVHNDYLEICPKVVLPLFGNIGGDASVGDWLTGRGDHLQWRSGLGGGEARGSPAHQVLHVGNGVSSPGHGGAGWLHEAQV